MSGSLIKLQEIDATGTTEATLVGIDSTYDVYVLEFLKVQPTTNNKNMFFRVTVSTPTAGTPDVSANYDASSRILRTSGAYSSTKTLNGTQHTVAASLTNTAGHKANGKMYLFNFANASEYSYGTNETSSFPGGLLGYQGGWVHTVQQACDGVTHYLESGDTFASGIFRLYGLKK